MSWADDRPLRYRLVGHDPVPTVGDYFAWGEALQTGGWAKVGDARWDDPDIHVSTVFLGVDHAYHGPPVLFESMVFAPDLPDIDQDQHRYHTWAGALAGHRAIVAELAGVFGPPDERMEAP